MGLISRIRQSIVFKTTFLMAVLILVIVSQLMVNAIKFKQITYSINNVRSYVEFNQLVRQANESFLIMDEQSNMWVGLLQFPDESQLARDTYIQAFDSRDQLNKALQSAENVAINASQRQMAAKAIRDARIYEGYFEQVQQNEGNYHAAARIMFVENTNASIKVASDLSNMESSTNQYLLSDLLNVSSLAMVNMSAMLGSGVFVVLFALFVLIFFKRIIAPLPVISDNMSLIAAGNLAEEHLARVVVKTKDEIFNLASSFQTMAGNLRSLIGALHMEKERLRVTLASIGDAVIATDIDNKVSFINPVAEHLTGWREGEALDQPIDQVFQIFNEETGQPAEIPVERVIRDGTVVGLANHTILISKDGTVFPIADAAAPIRDQSGAISGVVIVFRDDTERKKAERKLLDSNRMLADIIDFLPDATFVIDAGGSVIAWNKAIERMTNVKAQNMLGQGNYAYTIPFSGSRRPALIDLVLNFDEGLTGKYYSNFGWNGDILYGESESDTAAWQLGKTCVAASATVLRTSSGEVIGAIETFRDITSQKLLEASLTQAKDDAEKANRAKDDLLARISHEIRTPLNSIVGMVEMLFDTSLDIEQHDYVLTMQESASLLLGIINDILDFSRIKAGEIQLQKMAFQVLPVINGVIKIVTQWARGKGLELSSRIDAKLPAVLWGDPLRLRQILLNLTVNAVKFTRTGGISIRVLVEKEEAKHVTIRFEISDTGIGIAEEQRKKIFLPFVQVDGTYLSAAEGTGLGLTIASWLVRQMGGEIGVESEVDRGSTFWFSLRMERGLENTGLQDAEKAYELGDRLPSREATPKLILLAEDNPVNVKLTLLQLKKLGYDCRVVANGRDAVTAALSGDYALVLMDLQMPVMDGFEAIRLIRQEEIALGRHTPLIALTAHAVEGYREHCFTAGADDYLTKPVRLQELCSTLSLWLEPGRGPGEAAWPSAPPNDDGLVEDGFLMEVCGDGQTGLKMLEELIGIFRKDSTERLASLRDALERRDPLALREIAHGLKSGSTAVGALALASIASALEALGRSGTVVGGEKLLAEARDTCQRSLLVLNAIHRRLADERTYRENDADSHPGGGL